MDRVQRYLAELYATPGVGQIATVLLAVLAALFVRLLFSRIIVILARRTKSEVDDRILTHLRAPVVWSIVLAGIAVAVAETEVSSTVDFAVRGVLISTAALLWAVAAFRIGHELLDVLSRRVDQVPLIQPKTLPLFDIALKVVVVGAFLYFACVAWNVPLESWLTSAGIVGIAVGFAAKDTLANLFSGVFIIADAPYRLGDFIVLDNSLRGVVTDIGIRSTRLLTRDDIEVTVPNAVIGNAKIVNETSGPHQKMRVRVKISVAYESDIDQVRDELLGCVEGVQHVVKEPAPRVRFREFGDSGLLFELLAWIEEPVYRGRVLDALNSNVFKAFRDAGIEIPYPKRDVLIKHKGEEPCR
jgi:small-conductance mechanosensitive channel